MRRFQKCAVFALLLAICLTLTGSDGTAETFTQTPDEFGRAVFSVMAEPGTEVTVSIRDYSKNTHSYTFSWVYQGAEPGLTVSHYSPLS